MSVRTTELLMALFLAVASIGLMIKSSENFILWVPGRGPGAGAWPFWLSAGMFLSSLWTVFRWFRGTTSESEDTSPFMSRQTVYVVGTAVAALTALLIGTHIIGLYFSLIFFLFFFVKIFGGNGWVTSLSISILTPIVLFLFFEWALRIPLPKGYSEPLFYPLYAIIY